MVQHDAAVADGCPTSRRIGREILLGKDELLSGRHAPEIRDLLIGHGVLCFRDVHLDDHEQAAFSATLGEVVTAWDVSADFSVNSDPTLADYQASSMFWHFDGFGVPVPNFATVMTPRVLEYGKGGATDFADCYAAYTSLPADLKASIDSLQVRHEFETQMRRVKPWPNYAELRAWQESGHVFTHPMVWHHDSGEKSLLLGGSATYIDGMDPAEARALICRLNDWITRPENVYRYDWRVGDLVIWDNSGTLHRAVPYAADSKRLMYRTTIKGHETPR